MDEDIFTLSAPVPPVKTPSSELGFDLQWQDFRGWQSGDDQPYIHVEHFDTWAEAAARKKLVRDVDGVVACVTPTPLPHPKPKQRRPRKPPLKGGLTW